MNVRRWFLPQQLLFGAVVLIAAAGAFAQESITTKDGRTQPAKILGANGSSVNVQVGAGSIGIPLGNVASVTMAAPPEYAAALAAFEAKDYAKSLAAAKAVTEKYKGLPVEWAQQSAAMLGDLYVALERLPEAERAYQDFEKLYPGTGSVLANVGMARIAFSKKDYESAKQRLAPILAQSVKEKSPPKALGPAYSQAFYLSGQLKESAGDYQGALEDYMNTVAVFYSDRLAVNAAQERADALRKDHAVTVQ